MAKPRPKPKPKSSSLNPKNNPKDKQSQLQAVHGDLSNEIVNMVKMFQVEQEVNNPPINRLFGVGGKDLDGYIGQFKTGYKDIDPGNPLAKYLEKEKENAPVLKKISKERPWEDDGAAPGSHTPPKTKKS